MTYRKPDGNYTSNEDEYVNSWRNLIQPVLDATGLILYSFDPDFVLYSSDGKYSIDLPVWFVERLNKGPNKLLQIEHQDLGEWLKEARTILK